MKFPQSFIEELKNRLRLSEVVGGALVLKKAGREYHALCPFHNEKTPSFTLNDEKGFYHCFGCGAHGDAITFLMEHERLSYPEAIEKLAGMAGMALPKMTEQAVAQEEKRDQLLRLTQVVADWFSVALAESREADMARRYLSERGIFPETIRAFGLGYAPADRDMLTKMMAGKGITPRQLVDMGLLIAVEGKAPYARFRRRLMFPIRDVKGRVIAFGGRILPGEPNEDAAKYINSPETELFHKGRGLYHIDGARRAASKTGSLIVAEGYMDVIALAQAGMHHAVAPLGTAITEEQLELLWSVVSEPVLCLDGDNAGLRAMNRAMDLALPRLRPGKSLRIARLPKGEDPDSMVRRFGKTAFEDAVAKAQPLADVLWQQAFSSQNTTPEARAGEERALMARIDRIADVDVKRYYREDMRSRLRARSATSSTGGFVKAWQPKSVLPAMPRLSAGNDQALADAVTKLCALVAWWPQVLADGEREAIWLNLPLPLAWHAKANHALLDAASSSAAVDINTAVGADAATAIARALETLRLDAQADHVSRALTADNLWPELMNDVQCASLTADIRSAEMALAGDVSEVHFARLAALKNQMEELQRERSIFYRKDPI